MKRHVLTAASAILFLTAGTASGDVWKWVDPLGTTHFVETARPMFTWLDDSGKVAFSDTPDHEDAIAVQLVWHSSGSVADMAAGDGADVDSDEPETEIEREAREAAEQKYCQRVAEIHDSYTNAPRLYRTNEDGEREYLNKREVRKTIREIAAIRKSACK